jgi:error-prone DNA polymerase
MAGTKGRRQRNQTALKSQKSALHDSHSHLSSSQLRNLPNGRLVRTCGIVTVHQQPETAKGVIFVSLEDEDGSIQVIVWRGVREQQRRELLGAKLLGVYGTWQREGEVRNLIARRFIDLTHLLGRLAAPSRDFH